MRYLSGTKSAGLLLKPGKSNQLTAYLDSGFAAEKGVGRRSRSCVAILYGEALIHWKSVLLECTATSSTKAEYLALSDATHTIMQLRNFLEELGESQEATIIFQDNSGSIAWATASESKEFSRKRHIDVRYHHVREKAQGGAIRIEKISGERMKADFLTKFLSPVMLKSAKEAVSLQYCDREEAC